MQKQKRRWKNYKKDYKKGYNKRTNQLNDYIEKLTYNLIKKYDTIVFEENYAIIEILIGKEQKVIFPWRGVCGSKSTQFNKNENFYKAKKK